MSKKVTKVKIDDLNAQWLFGLDKERNKVIQTKVKKGAEKVLFGDIEWIITDTSLDVLQSSENGWEFDIMDERGYYWVTNRAHTFGRAINKFNKRAYDCLKQGGDTLPQITAFSKA